MKINLMPGELYIAKQPILIKTILGSCLSVILHNKRNKITAISHAQLPYEKSKHKCIDNCPIKCNTKTLEKNRFKYVTCSTQYMLQRFFSLGIRNSEIYVKIFGGASVLSTNGDQKSIGMQNIETAYDMIKKFKLKLINEDTGGKSGRTIYLYSETSTIFVRKHSKIYRPRTFAGGKALYQFEKIRT